jgi:hypothetical protein
MSAGAHDESDTSVASASTAVIHVVVEMFRVGTGIQLKTFADEAAARSWLRTKRITA